MRNINFFAYITTAWSLLAALIIFNIYQQEYHRYSMSLLRRHASQSVAQLNKHERQIIVPNDTAFENRQIIKSDTSSIITDGSVGEKKIEALPQKLVYKVSPRKDLVWPLEQNSFWLSSKYGPRLKKNGALGYHYGIDCACAKGTPVKAAGAGIVIEAAHSRRGFGNTVVIAHEKSVYQTRYAHLDSIFVKVGQKVAQGFCIGLVGDTGFVRGKNGNKNASHLHFEVKKNGKHIDPLCILA